MKAANYYREDQNNKGLAAAYIYISEAYNLQENHVNERYYLKNAIEIFRKENDSTNLASALHNLGYSDYNVGQYDTALSLFTEQVIYTEIRESYKLCLLSGNSGLVYSREIEI